MISYTVDSNTLEIHGELTTNSIADFWQKLQPSLQPKAIHTIDLSHLTSIDNAGVALLLAIRRQLPEVSFQSLSTQALNLAAAAQVDDLLLLTESING